MSVYQTVFARPRVGYSETGMTDISFPWPALVLIIVIVLLLGAVAYAPTAFWHKGLERILKKLDEKFK